MHRQSASWKRFVCAAIINTRGKKYRGTNQRAKNTLHGKRDLEPVYNGYLPDASRIAVFTCAFGRTRRTLKTRCLISLSRSDLCLGSERKNRVWVRAMIN